MAAIRALRGACLALALSCFFELPGAHRLVTVGGTSEDVAQQESPDDAAALLSERRGAQYSKGSSTSRPPPPPPPANDGLARRMAFYNKAKAVQDRQSDEAAQELQPVLLWQAAAEPKKLTYSMPWIDKVELLPDAARPHEQQVRVYMRAPRECNPCEKGFTLTAQFCDEGYAEYIVEEELWAGDAFSTLAPAPDPLLIPHRLETSESGLFERMSVAVPKCKLPGQYLLVKMREGVPEKRTCETSETADDHLRGPGRGLGVSSCPAEGILRSVQVPKDWRRPFGVFFDNDVEATKKEAVLTEQQLSNEGRCCCNEPWYCLWFRNELLKHNPFGGYHCPRIQEYDDGRPTCTRRHCGRTSKNRENCHEMHHRPGSCTLSKLPQFSFQGSDCGKGRFRLFK